MSEDLTSHQGSSLLLTSSPSYTCLVLQRRTTTEELLTAGCGSSYHQFLLEVREPGQCVWGGMWEASGESCGLWGSRENAGRQADREAGRQTDKQALRQTGRRMGDRERKQE